MKDQLDMLRERGITRRRRAQLDAYPKIRKRGARTHRGGAMKIVFVTPEKLEDDAFVATAAVARRAAVRGRRSALHQPVGPRFPPGLSRTRPRDQALGNPTVLALTATATPAVREDILHQLGIEHVKPIVKGFDRPNLRYEARKADNEADKLKILDELFTGPDDARGHRDHLHRDDQERARSAEVS